MEKKTERVVLIDAHAILHRAYHALPAFSNSKGEPTGALYGLSAMLIKIISDLKPDYVVAAYDLPKPTFRHEAYKDYKAGRAKAEDALVFQMKRSREIFDAFAIPIYDKEGFEADDILGTIVEQLSLKKQKNSDGREIEIVIASGDMDTLQLVSGKRIKVFTLKKGINDVALYDEEKVKERYGFSPKLLPDYKGLCGDASDNIKGVLGIGEKSATELISKFGSIEEIYKKLRENKEELKKNGIKERVVSLLEKGREDAEFSKVLATIRRDAPISFALPARKWVETIEIKKAEEIFQDLEFRNIKDRLRDAISQFDGTVHTKDEKEERPADFEETAVALWLINSNVVKPKLEDILSFAKADDFISARKKILFEIHSKNLKKVFEEIEKPLISVVKNMNLAGVKVDTDYLKALSAEYHKELELLAEAIHNLAGKQFNINSPKQLSEIIFKDLGLKAGRQKKTAGGAISTRESELFKLKDLHPIIDKILKYREFQKLLSTYIDNIPEMVGSDKRLHANFLQTGTTTGRMSSENPNLQNIPVQTALGRRIRNAFVAKKGSTLLSLDYSQIELRVAAVMSKDSKFLEIFKNNIDVHSAVASEVFGVSINDVDKDMRRKAKVINFGILYGMGVNALRQALSDNGAPVSREEASRFLSEYFAGFPTLSSYLENTKESARKFGFTETLFGRRRNFETLNSPIPYIRAAAERAAINAPIQGTAADIIKSAMVRVDDFLRKERLQDQAVLILQVHDELVYEVKVESVMNIAKKIKQIMESVVPLTKSCGVRFVTDVAVGANWGEMKRVELGEK